ncbi:putative GNAT family N-acyltransferase [Alkalibaculum bacchi]|uniref:Putative GNAT family N-acyltransferase n=1 Tax=Alkalibaculum bacchi TaxID=645887 RepID=A0A366IDZ9_9FIRM|nr:GNAT family N-acetyltransferase [Alkalibaculum bacchi]RBP67472.1 putative GNAT family N-acyltransferase [Alkalibaculum bacchi]
MEIKRIKNKEERKDAFYIRLKVFVEEQGVPRENELDEYEDVSEHIVLYKDKLPVATGRIRIIHGDAKLQRICVLKEYRKLGLGKVIIESLESIAREKDCKKAILGAQVQAKEFYEKLGYTQSSGLFVDEGIPHVEMTKQL